MATRSGTGLGEAKEFYEGYWERRFRTPEDPLLHVRYDLVVKALASLPPGLSALDCGSGNGALVSRLAKLGYRAEGIEIADTAVAHAQRSNPGLTFHQHSVEDRPWPIEPASFDVAISLEVIEHLLRPRELLLGMYDGVRPNGHIALTTPYHGRFKGVALAVRGFERHFDVEGPHVRFFTDRALTRLVGECGFRVLRVHHFGRVPLIQAGTFLWARREP